MGSLAKSLGQAAAKSLETQSAKILRTSRANKVPGSLSMALETTLKTEHDMQVFGMGTAAGMASRERYARFTHAMLCVYREMETQFDACAPASSAKAVRHVWNAHGTVLRRAERLQSDLDDVGGDATAPPSAATAAYVSAIRAAGDADRSGGEDGGARLLGHLYCRYFADLFGGQMLASPFRVALSLPPGTPRHYGFAFEQGGREAFIEDVYTSINEAGAQVSEAARARAVAECRLAFRHNVHLYGEEPMLMDACRGVANMACGYALGAR